QPHPFLVNETGASVPKEDEYHFLSEEDDEVDDEVVVVDSIGHRLIGHHHHHHHSKACDIDLECDAANAGQLIDLAAVAAVAAAAVSDSKSQEANDNCINAGLLAAAVQQQHQQCSCCKSSSSVNCSSLRHVHQLNYRRKFHKLSCSPHHSTTSKFVDTNSSLPSSSSSTSSLANRQSGGNTSSTTITSTSAPSLPTGNTSSGGNSSSAASAFLSKLGPIQLGRKLSQLRNSALNNSSASHSSAVTKGTENLQREALRKSNELGQYNLDNSQRYIRLPPSPHSKKFSTAINVSQRSTSPIGEKCSHKLKCNNNSNINKSGCLPAKQSPASNIIDSLFMCDVLASPIQSIPTQFNNHHSNSPSLASHTASTQLISNRSCTSSPSSSSLSSSTISLTPAPTPPPPLPPHNHLLSNSSVSTLVPRSANNNPPPRPKADKPNKHQHQPLSNMSSTSATTNMNRSLLTNNVAVLSSTTSLVSSIPSNVSGNNVHHSHDTTNGIQIESCVPRSCTCSPSSLISSSTTTQPSLNQCATCSPSTGGNPVSASGSSNASNNQQTTSNNLNSHHHHQQHQQFINKPPRGWLHPDHKLTDTDGPGVTYTVRYIGCLGVNTSMKSLDFQTRSLIAKESINRVCESAGLKTVDKKRRIDKRIVGMLADAPNMEHAGVDANLSITISYLTLTLAETGEPLAKHEMPNISFASGGDTDTLDFAAYVAKDTRFERACFVLECEDGRAQEVITTIGQAFELRFNEFLKRNPLSTERLEHGHLGTNNNNNGHNHKTAMANNNDNCQITPAQRIEDREYYNDLPGKIPPDIMAINNGSSDRMNKMIPPLAAPRSKKSAITTTTTPNNPQEEQINLIDLNDDLKPPLTTTSSAYNSNLFSKQIRPTDSQYVNCGASDTTTTHFHC
ncbi:Phosphotyrosine-binding domain, phosphotyrosine-interaction (PI) domain, partial [Dermatophagoides farinae]